jgi:hypothetical protein
MDAWRTIAAVAGAGLLLAGPALATETIRNVAPTPHGVEPGTPLEAIERAIVQAAAERQWYGGPDSPGAIVVSTTIRTHRATVAIGYDATHFWIDYRDSSNLDFNPKDLLHRQFDAPSQVIQKGPRIHANYNRWVGELADHIRIRTRAIVDAQVASAPPCEPTSIADELDKLDGLRQRGVLTQAEFDQRKRKLLEK